MVQREPLAGETHPAAAEAAMTLLAPVVCWPWHLRFLGPDAYAHGSRCIHCRRDVAAPEGARLPVCLYCGMDRGHVPLEEIDGWHAIPRHPWERPAEIIDMLGAES